MNCKTRITLLFSAALICTPLVWSTISHADTPLTEIQCLYVEMDGPLVGCYQFYLLDLEKESEDDVIDDVEWETSRRLATEKRCPNDLPCAGVDGFLATITDTTQNEFLRTMAINEPDFPDDEESKKEVWIGGFKELSEDDPDQWGRWVNNAGSIPNNNNDPDYFADWADGEPNNAGGNELHLAWNRYGLQTEEGLFNDEGAGTGQIFAYIVQWGPTLPGVEVPVLSPNIPQQPEAVALETVEPVLVSSFSCTVTEPSHRRRYQEVRIDTLIKTTPGCEELAARMPQYSKIVLQWWQRAFENSLNDESRDFAVTLIESKDESGQPSSEAYFGPVAYEERAEDFPVDPQSCTVLDGANAGLAVAAKSSPISVGVDLADNSFLGRRLTTKTQFCNRPRSIGKFSPIVVVYPVAATTSGRLVYASSSLRLRRSILSLHAEGCVNSGFLNHLWDNLVAASQLAQRGNPAAIGMLEDLVRFVFDPPAEFGDPWTDPDTSDACPNNPFGTIGSQTAILPFIAFRYIQNRDEGDPTYVQPEDIQCLIPRLSGDEIECLPAEP